MSDRIPKEGLLQPIRIAYCHVENTNLDSVSHARSERSPTFELDFNCVAPCNPADYVIKEEKKIIERAGQIGKS